MKIRLNQIERGNILRALIQQYELERRAFTRRFNVLRSRSRRAAQRAGFGPREIDRLIREVRTHRAKA